jgi:hypothetical protein
MFKLVDQNIQPRPLGELFDGADRKFISLSSLERGHVDDEAAFHVAFSTRV